MELFAFRDYLTVKIGNNRFLNPVAWRVMFFLVSIGITIAMFSTHCYHESLGMCIFLTSDVLTVLALFECTENALVLENERRR